MFAFQLAKDLGMTFSELGSRMTSEEFSYWMAYYSHQNRELRKHHEKHSKRRK